MSCYLYSVDHEQLTQSTRLSRLVLPLVRPFEPEANQSFVVAAQAKKDAELQALRESGVQLGYSGFEIDDPLDGRDGVRAQAFVLADASLPHEVDDALMSSLSQRGMNPNDIREDFPEARQLIASQALADEDVLVN